MSLQKQKPVIKIEDLSIEYKTGEGAVKAIRNVSFDLQSGETFGLAGESGSGKSTLGLAILNHLDENGYIVDGDITFNDKSLVSMSPEKLRSIRGNVIAHVPQDPKTSLNPSIKVGEQVAEVLDTHFEYDKDQIHDKTVELFEKVELPDPEFIMDQYPHELSGGMQQRVLVAIGLACEPELIVMDEPTSGLDVTTKTKILDLIDDLQEKFDTTILLISHDLGEIAEIADRVGILYAGELMEIGSIEEVFTNPKNPYTHGLLDAVPSQKEDEKLSSIGGSIPELVDIPNGCIFADRCEYADDECRNNEIGMQEIGSKGHLSRCRRIEDIDRFSYGNDRESVVNNTKSKSEVLLQVNDIKKYYTDSSMFDRIFGEKKPVRAVNGVEFDIRKGESFGLVGESGCGKSTLASTIAGLTEATSGSIKYRGVDINTWEVENQNKFRTETGIVFQNPHSSLNPKKTVYQILQRPLSTQTDLQNKGIKERIIELLEQVGLSKTYAERYPDELSGGEKQRVAIARAFATKPSFVILDEPVSALDLSVQANIINLLNHLQQEYNCAYLFISHNLSVVKNICDRIAVMYLGKVAEIGDTSDIFNPPYHPYTRALISNIRSVNPEINIEKTKLDGTVPGARDPPSGCNFCTRCPKYKEGLCDTEEPDLENTNEDNQHKISCHLGNEELSESMEF